MISCSAVFSIFLSPSHDYTTFENNSSTFTFTCSGNGTTYLWAVDGYALRSPYVLNKGIRPITSPDGLTVSSQLIVPTTKANSNVTIICIVLDSSFKQQSSNPVTLFLQGTCTFIFSECNYVLSSISSMDRHNISIISALLIAHASIEIK